MAQQINAFVAHSFNESDNSLVESFIKHFRNLEKLLTYFTWEHAQEAEPVPVSGKVLAKFGGKNLFIAICSRTEQVIKDSSLLNWQFFKIGKVNQRAFEWKTSDWIIQEIGLAIGRNIKIIVFLEDGVRKPGGLIGEIEYIPFSRDNLVLAFEKLHQMFVILSPKITTSATEATPEAAPTEERKAEPDNEWREPSPEWDQERFDVALFDAIIFGDKLDTFNKVDIAYRATPLAEREALSVWEGRIEFLRHINGEKFDFDKLKRLSEDFPENAELLYFVGSGYEAFGEHEKAAKKMEEAASRSSTKKAALKYLGFSVMNYLHAGLNRKSRELTEELRKSAKENEDHKSVVLSVLENEARIEKNNQLRLAIMEERAELNPSDTNLRFNLAYEHSQNGNDDMALHHYLKIPSAERSSTTWNNLGVSFDRIKMPVRAVSAWRTSAKQKDTLAMSNLGYKMLGAGLFDEATAECKAALGEEKSHKNVSALLTRLQESREDEDKKLDEALDAVQSKAVFYRRMGKASVNPSPKTIAKHWTSPFGLLQANIDGDTVTIEGEQVLPQNALVGIFNSLQKNIVHRIKYSGQLRGDAIFGDVKRSRDGETPSILEEAINHRDVLMYLDEQGNEIFVMENPSGVEPKFYSITRQNDL